MVRQVRREEHEKSISFVKSYVFWIWAEYGLNMVRLQCAKDKQVMGKILELQGCYNSMRKIEIGTKITWHSVFCCVVMLFFHRSVHVPVPLDLALLCVWFRY